MSDYSKKFIKAASIRAVKTVAQTAISLIGVSTFMSDVDWVSIASASALSGILSILTSISAGIPEVNKN